MDSSRQLIRWSIPGYVLLLNLSILFSLWLAVVEGRSFFDEVKAIGGGGAALIALSGLPLGFIVYQVYYHRYKAYGGIPPFRFYRQDRGIAFLYAFKDLRGSMDVLRWVDGHSGPAHIDKRMADRVTYTRFLRILLRPEFHLPDCKGSPKTKLPINCKPCRKAYKDSFVLNWTSTQSLIDYASATADRAWVKGEYTVGSDLYHALGAARTSLSVSVPLAGYVAILHGYLVPRYALRALADEGLLPRAVAVFIVWLLSTAALWFVFRKSRDNVDINYRSRLAAALAFVSRDLHPTGSSD